MKNIKDPEIEIEENKYHHIPKLKFQFQKIKTNYYLTNHRDPEKKISDICKNNQIDLCYSRSYRTI